MVHGAVIPAVKRTGTVAHPLPGVGTHSPTAVERLVEDYGECAVLALGGPRDKQDCPFVVEWVGRGEQEFLQGGRHLLRPSPTGICPYSEKRQTRVVKNQEALQATQGVVFAGALAEGRRVLQA